MDWTPPTTEEAIQEFRQREFYNVIGYARGQAARNEPGAQAIVDQMESIFYGEPLRATVARDQESAANAHQTLAEHHAPRRRTFREWFRANWKWFYLALAIACGVLGYATAQPDENPLLMSLLGAIVLPPLILAAPFILIAMFVVSFARSGGGASAGGYNTPQLGLNIVRGTNNGNPAWYSIDSQGRSSLIPPHAYARYNLPDPRTSGTPQFTPYRGHAPTAAARRDLRDQTWR